MSYLKYVQLDKETNTLKMKNTKDENVFFEGIIEYVKKNYLNSDFTKLSFEFVSFGKYFRVEIPAENICLTKSPYGCQQYNKGSVYVQLCDQEIEPSEVFKYFEELLFCWDSDWKKYIEWYPFMKIEKLIPENH